LLEERKGTMSREEEEAAALLARPPPRWISASRPRSPARPRLRRSPEPRGRAGHPSARGGHRSPKPRGRASRRSSRGGHRSPEFSRRGGAYRRSRPCGQDLGRRWSGDLFGSTRAERERERGGRKVLTEESEELTRMNKNFGSGCTYHCWVW
jgi:hypothetical protein